MPTSTGAKVLAEVYRLHHIPLPPITLQTLLKRGPHASPVIAASLQNDPQALTKWREVNAPAIVTSAQLLHREAPIRIARRIVDLENLPDELPQAKPIVSLREQLLDSFDQLTSCPLPANLASERDFVELHRKIRKEHATMHGNIAEAVQALEYEPQGLSESLDNFYNSRIGIRMLVDQHVAAQTPKPGFTGIVNDETSPVKIARDIVHKVHPLWQDSLNGEQLPEIIVSGDEEATYRYVPQHIEIILTEVFKNAVLNSVAAAKRTGATTPPPINVLISGGPHGVCVKVSDLGGGMTRKEANALANYYHTATSPSSSGYDPVADVLERRASGLDFSDSFGLRIAQLYAKYFGGELAIMPMEGHGVDTYIYMNCLTGASELNLPFRLLVVDALDLQDAVRGDQHDLSPPGVVEESDSQPLWKSKANTTFPQELGLILLSAQPATVKSLCVAVELARAPAQIEVFAALPQRHTRANALNHLDAVSRYLSADWKQCCDPLVWGECPSESLNTFREIDTRVAQLGVSECSFIKLVIQAPHRGNLSRQILLEDIEILGSTEDQNPSDVKRIDGRINRRRPPTHRPALFTPGNDYDELQSVLLDAGVPMDLVVQVANVSNSATGIPSPTPQQNGRDAFILELSSQGIPAEISGATLVSKESSNQDSERNPASPFDPVLRQYVEQTARERATLQEILATEIRSGADEVSSWQSSTISPTDPVNSIEIVLYTFGIFFTQCLLCGGADIQVTCIQLVERTVPLLKQVLGATTAFEGLTALIVLGVRAANTSRAFQSAMHLAYTVFQTEVSREKKDSKEVEVQIGGRKNDAQLRLIEEVACANWSYGLRIILERTLANPVCWSTSYTGKATPPSVNREFLQFVRLLVNQDETRTNFFNELLDLFPTGNAVGLTVEQNRLRLLRLVLRNDLFCCHLTVNVKTRIQNLCTKILDPSSDNLALKIGDKGIMSRLASECLAELEELVSGSQNLCRTNELATIYRHLEVSNNSHSHHSHRYSHTPFFIQDPLSDAEVTVFGEQLQRYFSIVPRPNALYRHSFVRASQTERESFQKGNIAFQGQVVEREPPKETFHQELQRKTAPFVFNISDKKPITELSSVPSDKQEIVSSFAAFKGTIERRSDPPRRSNKVSPAQEKQTPPVSKATTVANDQFVTSADTAVNALPTGTSEKILATETTRIPDILTASKTPRASQTPRATTQQSTTSLVRNFPGSIAATEQKSTRPENTIQLKANPNDGKTKKKGKEKTKTSSKNGGKDPDNCVLQ